MQISNTQTLNIAELYDQHFNKLYKFFYYKVLSKDIAEDLTQETFLAFANIAKNANENEIEKPSHFLYGIAKNIFMRYLKDKYRQGIPFSDLDDDFEEYCAQFVKETEQESETVEEKLLRYMQFIPEKQRVVMRLRFIEKLSLKEICTKLDKNMNYVKTMQKRGLHSLKEAIETTS